ncbi:hypothetical protein PG985_011157 [Apiospora marii]|uniref:Uncharacterized protein n=1 Tax=Apiospora marii TaxID=335849 RepID=A0ABR1SUP8_9PEZI
MVRLVLDHGHYLGAGVLGKGKYIDSVAMARTAALNLAYRRWRLKIDGEQRVAKGYLQDKTPVHQRRCLRIEDDGSDVRAPLAEELQAQDVASVPSRYAAYSTRTSRLIESTRVEKLAIKMPAVDQF